MAAENPQPKKKAGLPGTSPDDKLYRKAPTALDFLEDGPKRVGGLLGLVVGGLLGALGGLAFAGWELAVLGWFGVPLYTSGPSGGTVLVAYTLAGGICGALMGVSGLWGPQWALAMSLVWSGLLLSGHAGVWFGASQNVPFMGAVMCVLASAAIAQLIGRLPIPGTVSTGAAAMIFVMLALGLPLNLHLIPGDFISLAVGVDAVLLLVALVFGGLVGAITGITGDVPPVLPLALAALSGWLGAWPSLGRERVIPPPVPGAEGRPLVIVCIDGLRADRLAAAGYPREVTPNLDALAAKGFVYTSGTATAPWGIPALGSVLTGQMPYSHGAAAHEGIAPLRTPMRADVTTLADWLARSRYTSHGVTADPWLQAFRLDEGFASWDDKPDEGAMPVLFRAILAIGLPVWPGSRDAAAITDHALRVVAAQEGQPGWMLWVHYRGAIGPFEFEREDLDAVGRTMRPWPTDDHDAALHAIDRHLGRLLDALPPDALVAVVGTHGIELEDVRKPTAGVPPWARYGHTLYQEIVQVPIVLAGPGIAVGATPRPTSVVNLVPTVLTSLGIELPKRLDGAPLPEALGREPPAEPETVISQCVRYGPEQQAIRVGDFKVMSTADGRTPSFELDLDPTESTPERNASNEIKKRKLESMLPPFGAGVRVTPPVPLGKQLGAFGARLGR